MRSKATPLALACAAVLAAGCGGSNGGSGSGGSNTSDKRAAALECLKNEKKLDARPVGKADVQVGDAATGPRIRFFLTSGEAEARQFEGGAEGSEHIGTALLFTRDASEDLLEEVEACLDQI